MKKIIGIPGYMNDAKTHFGVSVPYLEFFSQFGTPRVLMPGEEFYSVDLLVLPGGLDLNPASYGEAPSFRTSNSDVFKQYFFDHKLKEYIDNDIPVLGICLGAQMLGAYFGSKLTQHLAYHETSDSRDKKAHKIHICDDSAREFFHGKRTFDVNSLHHQGIVLRDLGTDLIPLFTAENEEYDDISFQSSMAIVEVFRHKEKEIFGIQYHPEEFYTPIAENIINYLLKND